MHCSKGRARPVIDDVMARDAVGSRRIPPLGLPMMSSPRFRDARELLCRRVERPCPTSSKSEIKDQSLGASLASASAANRSYELAMSSIVLLATGSSN